VSARARSSESVCETRSVPSNVREASSILSDTARYQVGMAETPRRYALAHRTFDTTEGVLGRSSILSRSGEAGGTILVRRVNLSSCSRDRARGGSCRSAWNRYDGARGRHGTSEDGTISVKAPPAVASATKRGELASRMPRGIAVPHARARFRGFAMRFPQRVFGERVRRIRIGRSKRERIAALPLTGSGRANGSGPARAPAPNEGSR